MRDTLPRSLQPIHEFVFSLNVAFGFLFGRIFGYDGIFLPIFRLEDAISHEWGINGAASGYLALSSGVMLLTAFLFTVLRCFSRTRLVGHVLVSGAGYLALGLAPTCWFYVNGQYGWSWYPAEVAVSLLVALLYLSQKWTLPTFVAILLAGLHQAFWCLRFWEFRSNPIGPLVPIAGFCACFAWVFYVSAARARLGLAAVSVT